MACCCCHLRSLRWLTAYVAHSERVGLPSNKALDGLGWWIFLNLYIYYAVLAMHAVLAASPT